MAVGTFSRVLTGGPSQVHAETWDATDLLHVTAVDVKARMSMVVKSVRSHWTKKCEKGIKEKKRRLTYERGHFV